MNKLGIIGCGELAKQVSNLATIQGKYKVVGFFDDIEKAGNNKHGKEVLGNLNDIDKYFINGYVDTLIMAIGYKHMLKRKTIFDRLSIKYNFATIIHPNSYIDKSVELGQGVIIYPGVIVDHFVKVKENVIINLGSIISHDSKIGANSFISPNVAVAGFVNVGECANLGISTTIINNINIVSNVRTGGGTVIVKNIDKQGLYVGNPARFLRDNI